jgi:membrane protease YdiL (CAAX protease family)
MEEKQASWKKTLVYGAVVLLLFIVQEALVRTGTVVANMFSYEKFDPYNAYAWNCVHHITMLFLGLVAILILSRIFKTNFGFDFGDRKIGTRFVFIYTIIFTGVTLVVHIFMRVTNSLPVYTFPLSCNNIIGTLGFQLFLTGPAEEILFRAIPITIFVCVLGKNTKTKWGITIETFIAAFLFAIAHAKWSLFPFSIEADYSQLLYAFAQGIISGKAYQDSQSIIYPMFMHSIGNVLMVGTGYLFLLL